MTPPQSLFWTMFSATEGNTDNVTKAIDLAENSTSGLAGGDFSPSSTRAGVVSHNRTVNRSYCLWLIHLGSLHLLLTEYPGGQD